MANTRELICDGCGQKASPEHVARRLQRLEWATRYRPIHIATLFVGAFAPERDAEFLYAPNGAFEGEAAAVLQAAGISTSGKAREAVLAELQRSGFFLAHALECPMDAGVSDEAVRSLVSKRTPSLGTRIRRSLKPKKVVVLSSAFTPTLSELQSSAVAYEVVTSARAV